MLNDHTLSQFAALGARLVRPIYADYAFANIPATLERLLTGDSRGPLLPADCFGGTYPSPKRIVLMFVDAFGWQFWQRYGERSRIMRAVAERGVLTPISALFPSTTAASVSTLNLGVLPARHGVYEWNMYVPAYGETIQTLAFATLGRRSMSCADKGYDVNLLPLEHETIHQRLVAKGVRSIQLAHRSYAHSSYNSVISNGAEVKPHTTLPEALVDLKDALGATQGQRALINFYWAGLDTAAHIFGPKSPVFEAEVLGFWATLDVLLRDIGGDDTLFLFTADHGHIDVPAAETLYINERWPDVGAWLATSPTGETIWPNGSPRDMFLHVRPEVRGEAPAILRERLAGIADVLSVDAALNEGLLGPEPVAQETRRRLGDVLVLPYLGRSVWWREPGIIGNRVDGHHGGLTREELVTVLGAIDRL